MKTTRELLIEYILHQYDAGVDELTRNLTQREGEDLDVYFKRVDAFVEGLISVEDFLNSLTDLELIGVVDSQACLKYR